MIAARQADYCCCIFGLKRQPKLVLIWPFWSAISLLWSNSFRCSHPLKPWKIIYRYHWWVSTKSQHDCCASGRLLLLHLWTKNTTPVSTNMTISIYYLSSLKQLFSLQPSAETFDDCLLIPLVSVHYVSAAIKLTSNYSTFLNFALTSLFFETIVFAAAIRPVVSTA